MAEPGPRRDRAHDAKGTREAILNAAEFVFAEHGFDGARVDAIAAAAGYNKSLIFQYFGDKLRLYAEVTRRADKEMNELQVRILTPLLADETITTNAQHFKALLETIVKSLFDYLLEHPRLMRILLWEQAEGWQTYSKIISEFETEDAQQLESLFHKARKAGLIRSDFNPLIQLTLIMQICLSYHSFLPLFQMLLPDEDISSAAATARAREYITAFVVAGLMVDLPQQ